LNKVRKFRATAQILSVANYNVFVGNYTIQGCVRSDNIILHNNGVTDNRTLSNFYTTEKNGILNNPFNFTTVRNQRILYNGIDVSKINKKSYMKLLSVVFQDYSLFYFTLRDNVVFDKGDDKKFLDAIEKSGLHEKFGELELGEHTPLTKEFDPRGIEFSGGEGQKLACARAYYKDAPIIIFDEPTAALDPIAESALYERFNNIIENKTAVYISHRLASVRFCDKVAVFVGGEIAEYGTHDTLMEKNGIYRDMFEKQSGFYAEGENDEKEKI